jgi:hypothetical protein
MPGRVPLAAIDAQLSRLTMALTEGMRLPSLRRSGMWYGLAKTTRVSAWLTMYSTASGPKMSYSETIVSE